MSPYYPSTSRHRSSFTFYGKWDYILVGQINSLQQCLAGDLTGEKLTNNVSRVSVSMLSHRGYSKKKQWITDKKSFEIVRIKGEQIKKQSVSADPFTRTFGAFPCGL